MAFVRLLSKLSAIVFFCMGAVLHVPQFPVDTSDFLTRGDAAEFASQQYVQDYVNAHAGARGTSSKYTWDVTGTSDTLSDGETAVYKTFTILNAAAIEISDNAVTYEYKRNISGNSWGSLSKTVSSGSFLSGSNLTIAKLNSAAIAYLRWDQNSGIIYLSFYHHIGTGATANLRASGAIVLTAYF